MRIVLNLLFWSLLVSLCYGFYHRHYLNYSEGEKWIGVTVVALSFVYLPLFLVHRWKGKKLSDYTLSDQNIAKIRSKRGNNTGNQ